MDAIDNEEPKNQIRELATIQRRVIGVLMEKASTTPDQYPLTLKSLTSGCNQKSNRDPVTSHSEGTVLSTIDELREMGLVAEVFTDGGRAARYRHYMRYRFDFSEAEFAIIAELLLRGGQQPGELRTRAGRMVRIDSQESLRNNLVSLQKKGFVRANGPLDRRGVIVDHMYYPPKKAPQLAGAEAESPDAISAAELDPIAMPLLPNGDAIKELQSQVKKQQQEIDELKHIVARLEDLMR